MPYVKQSSHQYIIIAVSYRWKKLPKEILLSFEKQRIILKARHYSLISVWWDQQLPEFSLCTTLLREEKGLNINHLSGIWDEGEQVGRNGFPETQSMHSRKAKLKTPKVVKRKEYGN